MKNLSPRAPVIKVTPPGPKARQILARDKRWASKSYSQQVPVVWESAQDCIVTDVDGNRYIDLTSGIVVTNTGHGHPSVVAAIQEQSARLLACYDAVHENRVRLQEELARLMPDGDWRITSPDDALDLTFTPEGEKVEDVVILGLLGVYFRQPFGNFRGSIRTPDGSQYTLEECYGVTEDQQARW